MRSVAGGAFISQSLKMNGVLAALHGALVALCAGGGRYFFWMMDLMAVVAFKRLMRSRRAHRLSQGRFVLVALDAFFIAGYQPTGPEIMTVGAGHVLHFWKHIFCVGMTVHAELLLGIELVQCDGMAGGALDVFLEPVQGVSLRPRDFDDFFFPCQVAGHAHRAGYDNLVVRPFRYLRGTLHNCFDKHHISFVQGCVVAGVAVDALVHAGFPAVKSVLHEMAVQTELGIVLGVVVQVQGTDPYHHHQQPDQKSDDDFEFFGATVAEHHSQIRNHMCFLEKFVSTITSHAVHHHPKIFLSSAAFELKE